MNVEHRTSNIEHRIRYSVYFKLIERSESITCHSSLFIIHFPEVSHERRPLAKKTASLNKEKKLNPQNVGS